MTNTIANATLASVSETNRSRIMQHLYQHGISSRAQIAKALDIPPAAITKLTAKLIEDGAIKATGEYVITIGLMTDITADETVKVVPEA